MFIKNIDRYVSQIVHNEVVHKVVEGIADVPKEVRDHLTQFPEWSDVVEPVKQEIVDELHKEEKSDKDADTDKDDKKKGKKGSKGEDKEPSGTENSNGEQNPPEDK